MTCKPLVYSGNSSNLYYYGEPRQEGPGRVWCEVLSWGLFKRPDGSWGTKVPDYTVTVYVTGRGEVGRTTYQPKRRPPGDHLSPRTVTRLVREVLQSVAER